MENADLLASINLVSGAENYLTSGCMSANQVALLKSRFAKE